MSENENEWFDSLISQLKPNATFQNMEIFNILKVREWIETIITMEKSDCFPWKRNFIWSYEPLQYTWRLECRN